MQEVLDNRQQRPNNCILIILVKKHRFYTNSVFKISSPMKHINAISSIYAMYAIFLNLNRKCIINCQVLPLVPNLRHHHYESKIHDKVTFYQDVASNTSNIGKSSRNGCTIIPRITNYQHLVNIQENSNNS